MHKSLLLKHTVEITDVNSAEYESAFSDINVVVTNF